MYKNIRYYKERKKSQENCMGLNNREFDNKCDMYRSNRSISIITRYGNETASTHKKKLFKMKPT